jgi:hypothetical protein
MTQLAALCIHFLKGETLTIGEAFYKFHCTNLPREVGRGIERKFGVVVSKDRIDFESQFEGKPGYYYRYRLNRIAANTEGIKKMQQYISDQVASAPSPRTEKEVRERKILEQILMF